LVLLAILLFYRDWLPIVAAADTTAVHHITFYYLQSSGAGVRILPSTDSGFLIFVLHSTYVVVESALLIYMANSQKKEYIEGAEILYLTGKIAQANSLDHENSNFKPHLLRIPKVS